MQDCATVLPKPLAETAIGRRVGTDFSTGSAKTLRGTIKLNHEPFAEDVEIWLISMADGAAMVWFGAFTLPGRFNNAHLTDGSASRRFRLELDDGRHGQIRIRSFHFLGGENLMVQFEGVGALG